MSNRKRTQISFHNHIILCTLGFIATLLLLFLAACSAKPAGVTQASSTSPVPESLPEPSAPVTSENELALEEDYPSSKLYMAELPELEDMPTLKAEQLSAYYFMLRTCRPNSAQQSSHNIFWEPETFIKACFGGQWYSYGTIPAALERLLEIKIDYSWTTRFSYAEQPKETLATSKTEDITIQPYIIYKEEEAFLSLYFRFYEDHWALPTLIYRTPGDSITYVRHQSGQGIWAVHAYTTDAGITKNVWYNLATGVIELDYALYGNAVDTETACRLTVTTETAGLSGQEALTITDELLIRSYQHLQWKDGGNYGICHEVYCVFEPNKFNDSPYGYFPSIVQTKYRFHVTDVGSSDYAYSIYPEENFLVEKSTNMRELKEPFLRDARNTEPCLFTVPDAGLYGRTPAISPQEFITMMSGKESIVPEMIPAVFRRLFLEDKAIEFQKYVLDYLREDIPIRFVTKLAKPTRAVLQGNRCTIQEVTLSIQMGPEFQETLPVCSAIFLKDRGGWRMTILAVATPINYAGDDSVYMAFKEKEQGNGLWAEFYWDEWAINGEYTYKYIYDVYTGALWHKRLEFADIDSLDFFETKYNIAYKKRKSTPDAYTIEAAVRHDICERLNDEIVTIAQKYLEHESAIYKANPNTGLPELRYLYYQNMQAS